MPRESGKPRIRRATSFHAISRKAAFKGGARDRLSPNGSFWTRANEGKLPLLSTSSTSPALPYSTSRASSVPEFAHPGYFTTAAHPRFTRTCLLVSCPEHFQPPAPKTLPPQSLLFVSSADRPGREDGCRNKRQIRSQRWTTKF